MKTIKKEKRFTIFIVLSLIVCFIFYPYPQLAMWLGFVFAAYSAIANDSIQTIGTFIAANENKKWWWLWLFVGLIFVMTVSYSWYTYGGDVSYGRLTSKGLNQAPESFTFLQVAAPVLLLILTRMRMPVSTTFMLLSAFSYQSGAIYSVLKKSLSGYFLAFFVAIFVWYLFDTLIKKLQKGKAHPAWGVAQWITSGILWSVWIMQDAANIAVFLPRSLNFTEFLAFTAFIFGGLGILLYIRGGKIQHVVKEKSDIKDVRAATIVDFVYAIILYLFKVQSNIPMSTTWVFLGLLAGRELAIHLRKKENRAQGLKKTMKLIGRDALFALIGLLISIVLAILANPKMQEELLSLF